MAGPGDIEVSSNPVRAGGQLGVSYQGPGTLYYKVDGKSQWQEVPLDAQGNGSIQVPGDANLVILSDLRQPEPTEITVDVTRGRP